MKDGDMTCLQEAELLCTHNSQEHTPAASGTEAPASSLGQHQIAFWNLAKASETPL